MTEWRSYTVGEVAQVFDGPHATPKKTSSGPWFLSISSLDRGRLNLAESAHISEEDFVKWTRRVTPEPGDVLFSYETRLGDAALMPQGVKACLGRRMGILRPNRDRVLPRFLLLTYLAPEFQATIRSGAIHGATVDRIPLTELPRWPIALPDLSDQAAIVEVLGVLDDKIAVNERIAVTYEQLLKLQAERMGLEDEPDPAIAAPVTDFVHFSPKVPKPSEEAVYVDMAALSTSRAGIGTWARREPKGGTRFVNGDTLLARITPCLENGKTGYVNFMEDGEIGVGSTEFIVMRSAEGVPSEFSYFLARSSRFREHAIRNMVGSSGRQRVTAVDAANFHINRPDERLLTEFGEVASDSFAHMQSLDRESRILAALRDTLLPQLMSGKLRVRDAEKIVEDAV
ncbi:restriction endonuclease subunit S [Streptomyces sp. NRRL B-1140]|uniref:restriction endonuclease subunit S n=1 Tax=Streptomyces sp. NRRL B-1140 TaxID=1415549 RepID=UPI000AEB0600|nr:restriction endonuclease subunit S [Streptomyces sp. NRRL B-1140]